MKYSLKDFYLEFKSPFRIAHGIRSGTDIVILELRHEGITVYGESSLPPYLSETTKSVHAFIDSFFQEHGKLIEQPIELLEKLHSYKENFAAKASIDIAIHNYIAEKTSTPVYKLLNLSNEPVPYCTFTISMDTEKVIEQKLQEARDFTLLKIKLGVDNDRQIINTIRKYTNKSICVDVNQGWKNKDEALEMLNFLNENNTLFVEQPLPKTNLKDQQWLFERSPVPLFADESAQGITDLPYLTESFHGVNIKLMKCGGIRPALDMIYKAKSLKLQVMVGCMSETGCAVKAASQLSSLADYTDLDGPLLCKNNPFDIVTYSNGKVVIN